MVTREIRRWRERASNIPDLVLRQDAFTAIDRKRANIHGAALFSVLPKRRSPDLLRTLVAYEVMADYLDCTSERGAHAGIANGLQLHAAMIEALQPGRGASDYYRLHPWKDDGGYLRALVEACRQTSSRLPSYRLARALILRATQEVQVLALNHEPHSRARDLALQIWADVDRASGGELAWFEATAGASAWLPVLALLALAAEPALEDGHLGAAYAAYLPSVSLAGTMLDSYVDQGDDAASGDHSYIAHYASPQEAVKRTAEIVSRATREARELRNGHRHVVIVACMVAMYLSKDSANRPELRQTTRTLAHAGGSLTRLLLPVLRAWRIAYRLRSA